MIIEYMEESMKPRRGDDSNCVSKIEHTTIEDGSFLAVKVGSDDRPASRQDIKDIQEGLDALRINNLKHFVTHHNVDFKLCTPTKNLQLDVDRGGCNKNEHRSCPTKNKN